MFNKKPRRNFRQRKQSSSDEEEQQQQKKSGEDGGEAEKISTAVGLQGRGGTGSSKPAEEDEEKKPGGSDEEDEDNVEVTEKYTRKERRDAAKLGNVLSFSDDREGEEAAFRVKKSSDKPVLFQVRKKEASSESVGQNRASAVGVVPPSLSPKQESASPSSPQSLDDSGESDDGRDSDSDSDSDSDHDSDHNEAGGMSPSASSNSRHSTVRRVIIPNAAQIKAAKRQRRAHRAQKEYISLDRDGHSSASSTPSHYSRDDEEDRLDDDDDEPDDHERRIEFAPRLKTVRERIAERMGGSDGSLSGTDEEEQEIWEETQIEKGLKRQQGEESLSGSESSSSSRRREARQKKKSARKRIPKIPPAYTVLMVKKRLTAKLESKNEVHRALQAELRRMAGDLENARCSVECLNEESSENQLKFYRGMNLYVHNLVECLREKVVEVNALELELHTLLSDQMEALLAQRRRKVKEQAEQLQQPSDCTIEQSERSDNAMETQRVEGTTAKSEEDSEFPEDLTLSGEEEEQLQKKIAEVMQRSQAVFSDVHEDFGDVGKILSRFEEWRGRYSETYHSAYISMCLPKLLNPIIRHQLLAWNPLKDSSTDLENLPWFKAVETFCYGHGHEELEHIDRKTLSNVIEKTVVSKITAFAELVWDPLSRKQSLCLSDVCHKLREEYSIFEGEQSKPVKALLETVVRRLRSCVDEDVFIPLYPKKVVENTVCPQHRFREMQTWSAIKLLANMGKWDLLLPENTLKELMLDKLLNRYLMIALCGQTMTNPHLACKKIADCLPLSWFKGLNSCLPQLQNFKNHLVQKVHTICKEQSPEDPQSRSAVVELLQALSRIRCNDSIMIIAAKYHYEDVVYAQQLLNQEPE